MSRKIEGKETSKEVKEFAEKLTRGEIEPLHPDAEPPVMKLKFISAVNYNNQTIKFGPMTVLVGPNNSGKSQTLRDLRNYVVKGVIYEPLTLFKEVNLQMPSEEALRNFFHVLPSKDSPRDETVIGIDDSLINISSSNFYKGWIDNLISGNSGELNQLETLGKFLISYLHARTRFDLTASQEAYNLVKETPQHLMQEFYHQQQKLDVQSRLRKAFQEAFDYDIAFDWTAMKQWYFKVGDKFGELCDSKSGLEKKLSDGRLLDEQGDGYQAFTGILMAAIVFPDRPLLLDEPEAFLHPKQARVLGRLLGELSQERSAQIIVSTHSPAFIWGVVSGNKTTNVLRLNRTADNTEYTQVSASILEELTKTPLLSSQPVLESLFHQGVVVCEGDPDRAIYQFVAHQIIADKGEDLLFIHTNGKYAADVPIELLRSAGIPVAVIVDIDVLNNKSPLDKIVKSLTGKEISMKLEGVRASIGEFISRKSEEELLELLLETVKEWSAEEHNDLRSSIKSLESTLKVVRSNWAPVKKEGICFFKDQQFIVVKSLMDSLAELGVFVVPCGELEQWFNLGSKKGKEWNRKALDELQKGNCPSGLKMFVERVTQFLSDSSPDS